MNGDEADITCEDLYIELGTIVKAISRLRPDKAVGPDELSAKLLTEVQNEIVYPLLLLFKKSLRANRLFPGTGSKRTSHRFLKRAVETPLRIIDQLVLQAKYANFLRP